MTRTLLVSLVWSNVVAAVCLVASCAGCTPSPVPTPSAPEAAVPAPDASPCAVELAICKARLIRAPNGQALCVPCDGGP
jgi:hypothetical protein